MRFALALSLLITTSLSAHARMISPSYGGYAKPAPTQDANRKLSGLWGDTKGKLFLVGFDLDKSKGFILSSSNLGNTWTTLSSSFTTELKAIWGSSAKDLYVVGAQGMILRSTNGTKWIEQTSGTTETLSSVWGSSAKDVYAVGGAGTILRSIDNGKTWVSQKSGTAVFLTGVWGVSKDEVYAVGQSGTLLRTVDQGKTWEAIGTKTKSHLQGIFGSAKGDHIFAVGQNGTALYSKDHGKTWASQTASIPSMTSVKSFLTAGAVVGSKVYVVGGNKTILSSADFGATWSASTASEEGGLLAFWGSAKRLLTVSSSGHVFGCEDGSTWLSMANVRLMRF